MTNSRQVHPRRSLEPQRSGLRLHIWECPLIVGTRLRRLLRRFRGLPRQFILCTRTHLHVHALPQFSRAWLLQSCLTRDRHHLRLPPLRSVMATTGAANAHAEASPPFLVSCATSRINTLAPQWMRRRALCSRRLNGSLARLPLAVASGVWGLESATDAVRPARPGLPGWATSSWAPLAHLSVVRTRP